MCCSLSTSACCRGRFAYPREKCLSFVTQPITHAFSRSGAVANVLAYVPLGLLLFVSIRRCGAVPAVLLAAVMGGALSFSMETLPSVRAQP